jgi:hypothetical protein
MDGTLNAHPDRDPAVIEGSKAGRIAFLGSYLPRKCGIATFTSDLLAAVAAEHPSSECFSVAMNDIKRGYEYPPAVRFEIEEQDLFRIAGHFRPIGSNGFFRRGGARANFDQQPVEAQAMMSACLEAYRSTSDSWWYEQARRAFDWFLGWNDLGLELYSASTGGCRDGLHVDRVNRNQGAESTLAFLLSLAELRLTQDIVTSFRAPILIES